ncbi:MAG: dTMP kinase [Treponema sp.]|jgi:dTMP kinase|nr:dTMP kinase [Treponema sp.]
MEIISNFAVFEGCDGSGTSTQLALLKERLTDAGKPVFYSAFEPTGGPVGRLIRTALKKEIALKPETLAMLFAADRNEHLYGHGGIIERAGRGELAVSDRYVFSSLAYQSIECGDELPRMLNSIFPAPEVLLFFDIDPEIALKRINKRPSLEIFEYLEYQVKVREKYLSLLGTYRNEGVRVEVIDASKSEEEVAAQVWSEIAKMPIIKDK